MFTLQAKGRTDFVWFCKWSSKNAILIIQFSDSGLVIDTVEITAENARFEDAQIVWRICGGEQCAFLPPG